jgi:hypothetical protein
MMFRIRGSLGAGSWDVHMRSTSCSLSLVVMRVLHCYSALPGEKQVSAL